MFVFQSIWQIESNNKHSGCNSKVKLNFKVRHTILYFPAPVGKNPCFKVKIPAFRHFTMLKLPVGNTRNYGLFAHPAFGRACTGQQLTNLFMNKPGAAK